MQGRHTMANGRSARKRGKKEKRGEFALIENGDRMAEKYPNNGKPGPIVHFSGIGCRQPPAQKGYLNDICAIPFENKARRVRYPLCDTISKGYCAIWGVSRVGPLSFQRQRDDNKNKTVVLGGPSIPSLRAKCALISEPRLSTLCEMRFFPREKGKMAFVEGFSLKKAVFPFLRGKNRISQGIENRGSLISAPLALRVVFLLPKKQGKTHEKNKGFPLCGTFKILGNEGKNARKSKENRKAKKGRKSKKGRIGGSGRGLLQERPLIDEVGKGPLDTHTHTQRIF